MPGSLACHGSFRTRGVWSRRRLTLHRGLGSQNTLRLAGRYFDLRKLDGTKVHASAKAKDCSLLERARTLLIERSKRLIPALTDGVSAV